MTSGFDAIVIGAGIAGTASAYYLQRAGLRTALLDSHGPGWGASGRNPGFLWLQTKAAGMAMDFSLACRRFATTTKDEFGDFGFRACGGLVAYRDEAYEPVARAFAQDRKAAGLPIELLDRTAVHDLVPEFGPDVSGAVWNPLDAHQDTRRLIGHLAAGFEVAGGTPMPRTQAAAILCEGSRCRGVRLADGSMLASRIVVICAGPWSNELLAPIGLSMPLEWVRFEAAETAPAPFRLEPVICGQALFRFFTPQGIDAESLPRDPTERLAPKLGFTEQIASFPDGSLQFGCAYEKGSRDDRPTVAGQAMGFSILSRDLPGMAPLAVTRHWAGLVAQTPDSLPVIDAAAGPEGLVINTGHFFGNLAGPMSGHIVAELATGQTPTYAIQGFALSRFATPSS